MSNLLNIRVTIPDLLRQACDQKQPVELFLLNGKNYKGHVDGIGHEHVVITGLPGREFYGALIRMDHISAVEVRMRNS